MELTTHTPQGVNKVTRYGWAIVDEAGEMLMLHKDRLQIHPAYQREASQEKVSLITANWSWIGFGALVVGERGGEYWVIDGQHRAMAAKRRSDIERLPCVVFKTADVKSEARGFLTLNTSRRPVSALAKHKAMVVAGDEAALYVQRQLSELNLELSDNTKSAGYLKCVAWCMRRATENKDVFREVLAFAAELSANDQVPVQERLLEGLWVLNAKCGEGLADKRLAKRLREKGARALVDGANRATAYFANGGGKVWARGMLEELNKGLQRKFTIEGDDE